MMRLAWFISLLVIWAAIPAAARQVEVRSGEHGYFSRIVIELGTGDDWSFGRSGKQYVLIFSKADMTADIEEVFRHIPRSRLTDIAPRTNGPGLVLSVAPGNHAVAFRAEGGQAVIDILNGPAPEGSPFEVEIAAADPDATAARPLPHPGQRGAPQSSTGSAATLAYRPDVNSAASLPIYWRDLLPGGVPLDAHDGEKPAVRERLDPAADPGLSPGAQATAANPADLDLPLAPAIEAPLLPAVPDPDVLAVENALRLQVARAASQGLADIATDGLAEAGVTGALKARRQEGQPKEPTDAADAEITEPAETGDVAFFAETAMDRDSRDNPMARHLTDLGDECLPGELFDVAAWGNTDVPPAQQIVAARSTLTEEFDRPDEAAAEKLARLYLYFGMGAEAAQVVRAFDLKGPVASTIQDLGLIMEGADLPDGGALTGYAECDTAVALWAFLAAPGDPPAAKVNVEAITRAFSALPPSLRTLLGRRLSEKLIGIGALDAARAVRNAVARKAKRDERGLQMMDAELAMAAGARAEAEDQLDGLVDGDDPLSDEALVLAVRSRLAAGETIDPAQAEALAALAFERRNGGEAAGLIHLDLLAQAHSGALEGAFSRYRDMLGRRSDLDHRPTGQALFAALTDVSEDDRFLTVFFRERDLLAGTEPAEDLRLDLAERLAGLGFVTEVRELLFGLPGETVRGRMALARAALSAFDPAEVLRLTGGIEGSDAQALRAAAQELEGDHLAAAVTFAALGDPVGQARAAWAGGDIDQAIAGRPELGPTVDRLGLDDRAQTAAEGTLQTLAESEALLEGSADFREALGELLAGGGAIAGQAVAPTAPPEGAATASGAAQNPDGN